MHAQEHVLGEVLRPCGIAKRARDDAEHEPPVAADQLRERLVTAIAALAHEIVVCQIGHASADNERAPAVPRDDSADAPIARPPMAR